MREHVRSYEIRYYVERYYPDPDRPMSVVESYDTEEEGWAAVDRLNQVGGCWHMLMYVERREVELERS